MRFRATEAHLLLFPLLATWRMPVAAHFFTRRWHISKRAYVSFHALCGRFVHSGKRVIPFTAVGSILVVINVFFSQQFDRDIVVARKLHLQHTGVEHGAETVEAL